MSSKQHLLQLQATARKKAFSIRSEKKTPNEISAEIRISSDGFLISAAWKELRLKVLAKYGSKCMRCGWVQSGRRKINVDHIKPRKFWPDLALVFDNLQVLCSRCNKLKGNRDCTDYRNLPSAMEKQQ